MCWTCYMFRPFSAIFREEFNKEKYSNSWLDLHCNSSVGHQWHNHVVTVLSLLNAFLKMAETVGRLATCLCFILSNYSTVVGVCICVCVGVLVCAYVCTSVCVNCLGWNFQRCWAGWQTPIHTWALHGTLTLRSRHTHGTLTAHSRYTHGQEKHFVAVFKCTNCWLRRHLKLIASSGKSLEVQWRVFDRLLTGPEHWGPTFESSSESLCLFMLLWMFSKSRCTDTHW
jgi:hypothetical protein